jgi:hypothetical protein
MLAIVTHYDTMRGLFARSFQHASAFEVAIPSD